MAPTIPIKKENVPTRETTVRIWENIGKIPSIILDIINVQVRSTTESIIIGNNNQPSEKPKNLHLLYTKNISVNTISPIHK